MVYDSEQTDTEGTVSQFEKNRFFEGKLMTARDMQAEQNYHAERLELLASHTTGSGIVRGLAVRSVDASDGELSVSIDSGFAIDGCGRPIVVETPTTKSLPEPEGDECHLFIRFDEVALESVPVPDADSPSTETESNRLVEVFELTYRETAPDRSRPAVDIDSESVAGDPTAVADRIAADYHDAHRTDGADCEETAVYLGGFERNADGTWSQSATAPRPEYVVDHDLLYSALIEHLTDTDNPHQTEVDAEPPEPNLDAAELENIHDRVDYLQSELTAVQNRQQTATTHLRRKTLTTTARLFRSTAEEFADHSGSVSKTARTIARQAEAARRQDIGSDPEQYVPTVRELQLSLIEFGEELSGAASETEAARYREAVAELQSTLEADCPAVEVAIALDAVAEAAADLDVLYHVTPEA